MSLQFLVPFIKDLRESFKHKAYSMHIDAKPTRVSVHHLQKKTRANLQSIPCLLIRVLGQGWEFLAMTDDDWINAHHLKHGTDPDEELSDTDDESVPVPVMPVINNPGYFEIGSTWKEFKILPEREIHSQKLQSFL